MPAGGARHLTSPARHQWWAAESLLCWLCAPGNHSIAMGGAAAHTIKLQPSDACFQSCRGPRADTLDTTATDFKSKLQ